MVFLAGDKRYGENKRYVKVLFHYLSFIILSSFLLLSLSLIDSLLSKIFFPLAIVISIFAFPFSLINSLIGIIVIPFAFTFL